MTQATITTRRDLRLRIDAAALRRVEPSISTLALAGVLAVCTFFATVGADARWLAALGGEVVSTGSIPNGIPFASASSASWENVPVLGELVFHALEGAFGDRGFVVAQLVAVGAAFVLIRRDMTRLGAGSLAAAAGIVLLFMAAFSALVVARAQLFSLLLFPLLVMLLRAETRAPSRRIWLAVPVVALWGNLHGAVLVGLAVLGAYLIFCRFRRDPWIAAGVLASASLALWATPSLEGTHSYYLGVFDNEVARQGVGLWAPLSLTRVTDVMAIAGCVVLVAFALRSRPALWEWVALGGLAVMTVQTGRSAVWLALFAAPAAAVGMGLRDVRVTRQRTSLVVAFVAATAFLFTLGLVRGPTEFGAGNALLSKTLASADGRPVLAEDMLAEQVALAGGRIVIGNPIDAFAPADQRLYVDWLRGSPAADVLTSRASVLLVRRGGPAQRRLGSDPRLTEAGRDARAVLYLRRPGG